MSGRPITCAESQTPGTPPLEFVMAEHPPLAGQPVLRLPPHSASTKFAFSTSPSFGHVGEVFIAQLGRADPRLAAIPAGYRVVRANLRSGEIRDSVASLDPGRGGKGPQRPVDVKFEPGGAALYILDFGTLEGSPTGVVPYCCSGMVWKVAKTR